MILCHNLVHAVWQCHECEGTFGREWELNSHQGLPHRYECPVSQCELRFNTGIAFSAHLLSSHPTTLGAARVYSPDKVFRPVRWPVCKIICCVSNLGSHK